MNYNLFGPFFQDEDYYWFTDRRINGFYRGEKATGAVELQFRFPQEEKDTSGLYSDVVKVGDWWVFSPLAGRNIVLYHEKSKEVRLFPLAPVTQTKITFLPSLKFARLIPFGNTVFFIPFSYPAILQLNLSTMKLDYIRQWVPILDASIEEQRAPSMCVYCSNYAQIGEKAYLPMSCSNHVLVLDLKTAKVSCEEIKGNTKAFGGICAEGEDFWLSPRVGGCLTKWNPSTKQVQSVPVREQEDPEAAVVRSCMLYRDTLLLFGYQNNPIYQMDTKTGAVTEFQGLESVCNQTKPFDMLGYSPMLSYEVCGDLLYFINLWEVSWQTFDFQTKEMTAFSFLASKEDQEILRHKGLYKVEDAFTTLEGFCDYLQELPPMEKVQMEKNKVGKAILKATTQQIAPK